ncbi:hypothetical protein BH09BAC2_BH09BAC2_11770 [soil metagenome]
MMNKIVSRFLLIIVFSFTLLSCSHKNYAGTFNYNFKSKSGKPDYSILNYWAAHPWKKNPSDNIPADLPQKANDTLADVFFIHPTSYTDVSLPDGWNASIDNADINKKTDEGSILYQASVFNEHCRVFAPRYRQANLKAFYIADTAIANTAFDIAYEDVKAAFEYYLAHYNHGRKIIIASHSQGTLHAGRLLKEFFEKKALQKQLVCSYIIGLPVFKNYFETLQPCKDSTATGCFVTWRTFKEGYVAPFVQQETQAAYVINPLTWTLTDVLAPEELNKGGILRNFNKIIPGLVHAQVHGNVLWVNKPQFPGSVFLSSKNYHVVDYNLFYINIRQNVATRIRAFGNRKL